MEIQDQRFIDEITFSFLLSFIVIVIHSINSTQPNCISNKNCGFTFCIFRVILEHLVRMVLPELMVPKVNKDHQEKMVLQEALEMTEQMVLQETQVNQLQDYQVLKVQMENPATLEQREHQVVKDQVERKDQMEIREHRESLEMQESRALKVSYLRVNVF